MTEHDSLRERGRALEEAYFRKKDRELIERMRKAWAAEHPRRGLAAATGISDPELLGEMAELGFTPDTVALLPLVPVLQVAWAEDGVSDTERRVLVELARARGVTEHGPADAQLSQWMTERPDPAVFAGATRLIHALLDAHPGEQLEIEPADLVRYCEQVAEASGSFFSLKRISAEERQLLNTISAALKRR